MAQIVETATGTVEKTDVDPVTLDLIENGLRNARYEMDEVLFRTALSPGIREQHDEFPLIADPDGKMVVGQFGLSIPDFLDGFDGTIEEGDVLLTSDPYACGAAISHANDWLVVMPIFHEGRVVGWASMFGHMSDVGGGNGPYELKLSLTRTGEKVHLDFTGSSPQAAGPINYYINENLTRMFFGIYMITVADPQILWNDGFYPLVDVTIPDGSYWKPRHPASLNGRNHGIGRVFDLFGGLLGQTNPALLNAAGFSSSPHFMYSGHYSSGERKGEWFQLYSIGFGGIPGRPLGDGPDGHSLWPSFVNIPCEYLESYYPLRIETWETVPDTGGPGLHRGGNGVDVAYVFEEPGEIAIHDDRWLTYPWGVNGGEPGARGRKWVERADGTTEVLPSKIHDFPVDAGDLLHFVTWGGGGWGDPLERDPELVAREVRRGLVAGARAGRDGVSVIRAGEGDAEATATLRDRMRADRPGELPVFDMGPPVEELLARCEEETGLPAPKRPVWTSA